MKMGICRTTAVCAFVFMWASSSAYADVVIKGMRLGMHIEHARQQASARIVDSVDVSPIQRTDSGRLFFTIGGGQGRVVANNRERVEQIILSGRLVKNLFGFENISKEQTAFLFGEIWNIPPSAWRERVDIKEDMRHLAIPTFLECYVPQQKLSISISDKHDITASVIDIETMRRNIER